jgi:hypothetical protein
MKTTQLKILALLAACSVLSSPLFFQATASSQEKSASSNTKPFIKLVNSTGSLIQTIQDARGGFVSISQQGSMNFLLRRVRPSGEPTLERILRFHSDSFVDRVNLNAISETTDRGFVVVGNALNCGDPYCDNFNEYKYAAIATKLRPNGSIQWKKRFTPTSTTFLTFYSVASLPDGGFIANGAATFHGSVRTVVVRFNSTGGILWSKSYPSLDATELLATPDNAFILVGYSKNANDDFEVIKLSQAGNVVWGKSFKVPRSIIQAAIVTSDRGIVLAGVCVQECEQLFLIRLDLNGEITWKTAWKGKYDQPVFHGPALLDFIQTPDGGYALSGQIVPVKGMHLNSFLLKIDPSLNVVFQKNYRREELNGSLFASGSRYLIFDRSGKTGEDTLISKVNSQGIMPGCSSFYSVPTERIAFGELTTKRLNVRAPASFTLGTTEIEATSAATHQSVSTVCQ